MAKFLIDEYPLIVLPSLAVAIGLPEAIILQQMHYWLEIKRRGGNQILHNGSYWIRDTQDDWAKQFPFFSKMSIRRYLKNLVDRGLVTKDYLSEKKWDRTSYYSIDYNRLQSITSPCDQNEHMEVIKLNSSPCDQNEHIYSTETSTETSTEIGATSSPPPQQIAQIAQSKPCNQAQAQKTDFEQNTQNIIAQIAQPQLQPQVYPQLDPKLEQDMRDQIKKLEQQLETETSPVRRIQWRGAISGLKLELAKHGIDVDVEVSVVVEDALLTHQELPPFSLNGEVDIVRHRED